MIPIIWKFRIIPSQISMASFAQPGTSLVRFVFLKFLGDCSKVLVQTSDLSRCNSGRENRFESGSGDAAPSDSRLAYSLPRQLQFQLRRTAE